MVFYSNDNAFKVEFNIQKQFCDEQQAKLMSKLKFYYFIQNIIMNLYLSAAW